MRRIALLSCLLGLPALQAGLVIDDYFLAMRLHGPDGIRWRGLLDAFTFVAPGELPHLRELGEMPWWSDPELALNAWRPLSALTHALDFVWAPPWWMHVESLLLLALLNLAVAAWFQRLIPDASKLALWLFALAPGHVFAASWIANRNAVLAAIFCVLTLLLYERRWAWLTFALSLLSGEIGASSFAFVTAYALTLDPRPWKERLAASSPFVLIAIAWAGVHYAMGYGASESSLYVSPLSDPLRYLAALAERLPVLLFGQWILPGIAFSLLMAHSVQIAFAVFSALCLMLVARPVIRLVRVDARARFCLLGGTLALVPLVTSAVHDRLLIIADIGTLALLALIARRSKLIRVRLVYSALLSLGFAASLQQHVEAGELPFEHNLRDAKLSEQTLVFVNTPCAYYAMQLDWLRRYEGGPIPKRLRILAPGIYPLELTRTDAHTLRFHVDGGLLQPLGRYLSAPISPVYLAQLLNQFSRATWNYRAGDRIELSDTGIELVATIDGYPTTVDFHLREPLAHYRFVQWRDHNYVEFTLPEVGSRVKLAPVQ